MEYVRRNYGDACEQERGLDGWWQRYTQLKPGGYSGSIETLRMPGVSIVRERISVAVEERVAAPAGRTVFVQPLSPATDCRTNATRIAGDSVMMLHGGDEVHVSVAADSDLLLVTVDDALLPPPRRRASPLRFARSFPEAELAGAWFLSLLLGHTVGEVPAAAEHTQVLVGLVADKLAHLFDRIAAGGRAADPATRADFRLFLRARELVAEEREDPHTIAGLARRLDVSTEALRRAFLVSVGVGPGTWLRQQRLDGARRDLAVSAGAATTVSEVAMKWGFWHLGRFSAYYAAQYGETPSQTVRRAAG
ncbi:helix-turn-helix domain-containing protein [Azospirillum sp. ST 5-10]|uniref:helix-turn-helix domain-containing protein n=1 Tax=unclassified Azospirillum TaxID=2630922 RepID=UPI003F4A2A37